MKGKASFLALEKRRAPTAKSMARGKPSQLLRDKLAPKKTKNKKRSNPYSKSPFLEEKNGGKKMLRRTDPEKNGNRLAQELEPFSLV